MTDSPFFTYSSDDAPLFRFWSQLSPVEREELMAQMRDLDRPLLNRQREILASLPSLQEQVFDPFLDFAVAGNQQDYERGKKGISEGLMGCLLLAGGQGSRLRFNGPKGLYPISLIKHKSLFQLSAEKVLAASRQSGYPLLLAIMTSSHNQMATQSFFKESHFFGLDPDQVFFFTQGDLPLLDKQGHLFLEAPYQIATGPNGNGLCLHDFVKSGIASNWLMRGVRYINLILVDNPLADPFDAELLGFHMRRGVEVTIKCAEKRLAEEKVGVLVKQNQQCRVIEYTEFPNQEKLALAADGHLKHRCANLSLFCFTMDFIQRVAEQSDFQLHPVWKAARYIDAKGISHLPDQPNAWKFETFIFDVLQYSTQVAALLYPRHQCFAPLKNLSGLDSPLLVQQAIQLREKQIIQDVTGFAAPSEPFELAADFYYPTPSLLSKWKGKKIVGGYIEP